MVHKLHSVVGYDDSYSKNDDLTIVDENGLNNLKLWPLASYWLVAKSK